METLEYHLPVGATRLRSGKGHHFTDCPVPKVTVPAPNPSPPASPTRRTHPPFLSSMASPTLSTIPQLLLSASLPSMINSGSPGASTTSSSSSSFTIHNPKGKADQTVHLLSSKDPLSLPIMTNNFKRFVTVVGPVFWLQDRIEEIVLWKRGALWTTLWMAAYTLPCFYPRILLLLPHLALIGTILATYSYPSNPIIDPLYAPDASAAYLPSTAPLAESVVPWQANIQAIQNLMGAYADFHAIVEPYVHHFCLTTAHFSNARQFPISNTSSSSTLTTPASQQITVSRSPYTTHILTILVFSFFPLLFIIHLPWFPVRTLCILAGWTPILFTHPYHQAVIPALRPVLLVVLKRSLLLGDRASSFLAYYFNIMISLTACYQPRHHYPPDERDEGPLPKKPISTIIQRFIDNDRLSDECWNSEMREVELWENERHNGPPLVADGPSSPSTIAAAMRKGWSKQHLKSGERRPWTRRGDGSNDVTAVGAEASGEVSSNLTFSLTPGWSFVESEDWRKDLQPTWSGCGCDEDGWVYTNDSWLGARPAPYTSGGGSVTRRRRWLRRVWYSRKAAEALS